MITPAGSRRPERSRKLRLIIAVVMLPGCPSGKRAEPTLSCPAGAHQVGDSSAGAAWCEKPGPSAPVRHGPYLVWGQGILIQEGEYADGKQVGKWTSYFPNGSAMEEGRYATGQKDGVWKRFGQDGGVVQEDHFRAGILHGLRHYRPTSDHDDIECYVDGVLAWKDNDGSARRPCPP